MRLRFATMVLIGIRMGNMITLTVPSAAQAPCLKIRYAWKDNPLQANVRSLTGLPMSSFELQVNK